MSGCSNAPTSDDKQQEQQEKILQEGVSQVGMPAIKNFREKKLLKDILELRDQNGLVTYTYYENEYPHVVPGRTALGGKLTYVGDTIGYGIPYSTQYSNPEKVDWTSGGSMYTLPQAEPNGLFSPSSADGTWIMMDTKSGVKPQYIESKISVYTFQLPFD